MGSTSNSKGVSTRLVGSLDSWGRIGGGAGPVGTFVFSWTFAVSPSIETLGGGGGGCEADAPVCCCSLEINFACWAITSAWRAENSA